MSTRPGTTVTGHQRGRGAAENPANRFERLAVAVDGDALDDERRFGEGEPLLATELLVDHSRSIVSRNESPDVGFEVSINPYRGCEHGCIYCYARPTHEYLGFSLGLDFETKILVKPEAPRLLREELMKPSWQPQLLMLSGVTDCYQPAERRLGLTRQCIEVLAEFRNPAGIITKNRLVTRDLDLLRELAAHQAVAVVLSVTTLDAELARRMEPRASAPRDRLAAIAELAKVGIPVGVNVAPVVPAVTDHELPAILTAAREAGAQWARYLVMRLPHGVAELFTDWLAEHLPDRRAKVLGRIRELRGGRLNDPRFVHRHRGEGPFADHLRQQFELSCRRLGLATRTPELSTAAFRRPGRQLPLF